jgi:osmotically-inducible protein OsmY
MKHVQKLKHLFTVATLSFSLAAGSAGADHMKGHRDEILGGKIQETAKTQSESVSDSFQKSMSEVEVLATVRKALVDKEDLSISAKNAQIVLNGQSITLQGHVVSEQEKNIVEQTVQSNAPGYQVSNDLQVSPE